MQSSLIDTYAPPVLLAPLLPVLLLQGRYVRRVTPLLPAAAGPDVGLAPGAGPLLSLLVLCESTVAGVGAPDHASALTGQVAQGLAERTGRAVRWRALGASGYTAARARERLLPKLPAEPADAVVLALGVNDALQGRAPARWAGDLASLIAGVRERVGHVPVLLGCAADRAVPRAAAAAALGHGLACGHAGARGCAAGAHARAGALQRGPARVGRGLLLRGSLPPLGRRLPRLGRAARRRAGRMAGRSLA